MSLLLLSLPWAGCQYLQAVDLVLRDIQATSLKTNAESIASRLVTKPELFNQPHINVAKNVLPLYTTLLSNAPIIDGYEDDWRSYNAVKKNINNGKLSASIQVGEYRERVYFFISVNDDALNYYNPAQAGDFSADHLVLTRYNQSAVDKEVYIYSSAPGALVAHYKNQNGRLTAMSAIKGIWREHAGGYQLELEIDKAFLATGFNLDVIDFRNGEERRLFLNDLLAEQAVYDYMEIVSLSVMVQEELASIGLDDISVYILNNDYLTIAVKEAVASNKDTDKTPWFVEWLYRKSLAIDQLPLRSTFLNGSQWILSSVEQVLWYRIPKPIVSDQTAVLVTETLFVDGEQIGILLLEKTSDHLVALTNAAFNRLFFYSLGIFVLLVAGLLFYASWLSWRISRLSYSANRAVCADGLIQTDATIWPELGAMDELGDLSRSYHKLLLRLRENQDYLRDLSGKLSHELRTPIAIVKSSLDNISQVTDAAQQQQYQSRAKEGIERLSHILNAMSAANRIEESIVSAEFSPIDMRALLRSLTDMYQDIYTDNTIRFIAESDVQPVSISVELFVQMMDKMVDNAVSFSPADEVVSIYLRSEFGSPVIAVENVGPLLPEKMEGRLFDSMVSIRKGAKTEGKVHLGLGLYIVRMIASLHQADVLAANREDGKGVVFSVRLLAHNR